jgi:hypothetical protein
MTSIKKATLMHGRLRVIIYELAVSTYAITPLRVGRAPKKLSSQWAEAMREHNKKVASGPRYLSSILPIREGLIVAYHLH